MRASAVASRNIRHLHPFAVLLAVALAGAPVHAQEDVPVVEAGSGDIDARLTKVERLVEGRGLLDLANQVEALQREVQRLRGEIEQQQHLIEQLSARQAKGLTKLDERMQEFEGDGRLATGTAVSPSPSVSGPDTAAPGNAPAVSEGGTAATAPPPQVAVNPPTQPAPAATSTSSTSRQIPPEQTADAAPVPPMTGDPDQAYSAAFNALKTGKYDDAIAQFNNFLVTYPDSPRADSAQYWLGEAYYVNKQYDPAIIEYQKLVAAYPGSQKVSQAMLKIGFCQQELGQSDQARITLQEVVQRYPGTTSARMAEDRLQRMRLEQPP